MTSLQARSVLNRCLLALAILTSLAFLLLRFTSWTDQIITVGSILASVLGFLFPKLLKFAQRPWFASPLFTALLSAIAAAFCIGVATIFYQPQTLTQGTASRNHLVANSSFEGTNEGWGSVSVQELSSDETGNKIVSEYPGNSAFPGSTTVNVSQDQALLGDSSLAVTNLINREGEYKGFLFYSGVVRARAIAMFVMVPKIDNASINYIQLCVPSLGWPCSGGTDIVEGQWTPIVIDLSQVDGNGLPFYSQEMTDLAIQWRFTAQAPTSIDLYFDALEVYQVGL